MQVEHRTFVYGRSAELGLHYVAQQALEQDQADFLGRGHYERSHDHRGYRNGTKTPRSRPPKVK